MFFTSKLIERVPRKLYKFTFEQFEYFYKTIPNQIKKQKNNTEIPNVVYQTWIKRELPWRMAKEIKKFRELNFNHSFLLFTNKERDEYMHNYWGERKIYQIYKNCIFQASKTDIWRYCILYERGGYYFDIKSSCEVPLSKLIISNGATLTYENYYSSILPAQYILKKIKNFNLNLIANWGIGFKKKHPLLEILISNIEEFSEFFKGKIFQNPKSHITAFTGPGMLTKSYRDYLEKEMEVIKFDGIDFSGKGIYQVKGGQYRHRMSSHYATVKNQKILI